MTAPQDEAVSSRKNRWHQSTLSSLLDGCSWQYMLTYVADLPVGLKPHAAVGTAFHSVVEEQERARMNGNDEPTLAEMKARGRELLAPVTSEPEHLERLAACLTNYEEHIRPYLLNYKPLALEPEFTINLVEGAKPVGGYIDGVYEDKRDGQIIVIDHKTVGNFSRWRNADGHRHQAAMYAAALTMSEDFPDITYMPEMHYLLVRTSIGKRSNFEASRVLTLQPDLEDVRVLGDRVRQAEAKVLAQDYTKNTDWALCSKVWCPYYERCLTNGELSGQVQDVLLKLSEEQQETGTNHEGDSNV